ncbi:MAG: mechanosensitive ion channel, partial [Isosphaeraceae bacterium]|nr:mechanosensitive ion channel [Isosphaeraceae bacterium]
PGATKSPLAKAADQPAPAPTQDNPEATVAATAGPIAVDETVPDEKVQAKLEGLLPQYPGVRSVEVRVEDGVVTLDGQVEDAEVRAKMTDIARRVKGVSFVVNRMKTDAQVLTARQLALRVLEEYGGIIARNWLLVLLALAVAAVFLGLARLFDAYSETLLAPFVRNLLLRSVVGSLIGAGLVIAGLLLGLQILGLTQAVLSVLGLAGVVGLAVGFAFRDITENFIASVLLGVRRPFRVGDYVEVAGQAGVVQSLNTRATVLVTLEGKHVRIPNATVFKEIMINATASPSVRGTFDVLIPYEASTATALDVITRVLRSQEGLLPEPPARALVEALEPGGVRLRAYFWMPAQGIDGFKLLSDARLTAKVALQRAGITPPTAGVTVAVAGRVPIDLRRVADDGNGHARALRPGALVSPEQARANLDRDTRAAAAASTDRPDEHLPMEHVLKEAESTVSSEGENLLDDRGPQAEGSS